MQITRDIIIQTESSSTNQDQDELFQALKILTADLVVLVMLDMVDGKSDL